MKAVAQKTCHCDVCLCHKGEYRYLPDLEECVGGGGSGHQGCRIPHHVRTHDPTLIEVLEALKRIEKKLP